MSARYRLVYDSEYGPSVLLANGSWASPESVAAHGLNEWQGTALKAYRRAEDWAHVRVEKVGGAK